MPKKYVKPHTRENILTETETEELVAAIETMREYIVIRGLLYSGMRVSELIHMRKDWINWERNLIIIPTDQPCDICPECKKERWKNIRDRQTKKVTGRELSKPINTWAPKTKAAIREIYMIKKARETFENYFQKYDRIRDLVHNRVQAHYTVTSVAKRAGIIHKVFPHALRGTFATSLASRDFLTETIQDTLGWEDYKIAKSYVKLSGAKLRKEFEEKWQE